MLTKTKSPELHRLIDHEDRATTPQLIRLAADVLAAVEVGVFPPRVGWQCADCPVRRSCRRPRATPSRLAPRPCGRRDGCRGPRSLRRVFAIEVLVCPRCAGPRRILDTVTEPKAVRRLLGALGLAAQPPPGRPVTAS